jgi:hypothetical protein
VSARCCWSPPTKVGIYATPSSVIAHVDGSEAHLIDEILSGEPRDIDIVLFNLLCRNIIGRRSWALFVTVEIITVHRFVRKHLLGSCSWTRSLSDHECRTRATYVGGESRHHLMHLCRVEHNHLLLCQCRLHAQRSTSTSPCFAFPLFVRLVLVVGTFVPEVKCWINRRCDRIVRTHYFCRGPWH